VVKLVVTVGSLTPRQGPSLSPGRSTLTNINYKLINQIIFLTAFEGFEAM